MIGILLAIGEVGLASNHDDDEDSNADADNHHDGELRVTPAELLLQLICLRLEGLGLVHEVLRLTVNVVDALAALEDLVHVVAHDLRDLVDRLVNRGELVVLGVRVEVRLLLQNLLDRADVNVGGTNERLDGLEEGVGDARGGVGGDDATDDLAVAVSEHVVVEASLLVFERAAAELGAAGGGEDLLHGGRHGGVLVGGVLSDLVVTGVGDGVNAAVLDRHG